MNFFDPLSPWGLHFLGGCSSTGTRIDCILNILRLYCYIISLYYAVCFVKKTALMCVPVGGGWTQIRRTIAMMCYKWSKLNARRLGGLKDFSKCGQFLCKTDATLKIKNEI